MSRIILGEDRDKEAWKLLRRQYLTASNLISFLNNGERARYGWELKRYHDSAEKILNDKRTDAAFEADEEGLSRMWHGREDEDHNRRKILGALGVRSRGLHLMVGNERWPYLSCTLDGVCHVPTREVVPDLEGTVNKALAEETLAALEFAPNPIGVVEMKQTNMFGGKNRLGQLKSGAPPAIPGPYQCQMQLQMHLTGYDWGLGAAQCGTGSWAVLYLEKDEHFATILDRVNETIAGEFEVIRQELAGEEIVL